MNRLALTVVLLCAAVWLGARGDEAAGCAIAPRPGDRVSVYDEAAYIVWDEKAKTEHFIRRAAFGSTSADFGFLVPSPSAPEVGLADDHLFDALASVTAPKYVHREEVREVDRPFGCLGATYQTFAAKNTSEHAPTERALGGVQVLNQKRVGDYDATVLKFRRGSSDTAADGAAELAKWLARHGYQSSPVLAKWLERYVADEWCVTAFKIAADPPAGYAPGHFAPRTKPIRMSFKAEKPFYPYREPEAEGPVGSPLPRALRVFLAAPGRFAGKLGDGSRPWPGEVVWAGPVEGPRQANAFRLSGVAGAPDGKGAARTEPSSEGWWLTEFEDRSSPRPGTDEVYFERAADQGPRERPPIVAVTYREVYVTPWWHGAVYVGSLGALALGGALLWRTLRRS